MTFNPLTGEFAQLAHETAFLAHKLPQTRALLGFTLVFCTLFYLAFAVSDFAALGYGPQFLQLCAARGIVAATAGTCAWCAYRTPLSVRATRVAASTAEIVALGCFMFIAVRRPGEFHWHAMSLAIMLIVIYLYIPNSFANALLLASGATAAFLALALRFGRMSAADVVTMVMLLLLANAFGALAARRFNCASREEYQARTQLQHAAARDHLTGCFNRRHLHDHLMRPGPRTAGGPLTVVLCDIDNFKRINDTYGHACGDAVLRSFADLLGAMTRDGIDSVVRYGGEEFLAILPGTDVDGGIRLAERLRTRFAATGVAAGDGTTLVRTTASFGVACADSGSDDADRVLRDLIAAADKLMYDAKRGGRDRVCALRLASPRAPVSTPSP
ncbi:GGDEF domain-containing protein [Massilia pinisoli]|uniref:diguanylate cyclase n=1 Tax=Massilia pinisoli TaxID=1772194 RepID=A0ABT1ZJB3_9BURK|nr:GGDEF domain-containing protein [Massilia pinisoli]MCS0579999.1 GGDEF domain-containing protein [Massilia pinisoli]